jgi:hypothetical protein
MLCSLPIYASAADAEEFARELVDVLMHDGDTGAPLYLRIQRFHTANLSEWIESGKKAEDYKCPFKKSLFDSLVMPSSKLMYHLDPNNKRPLESVMEDLTERVKGYQAFLGQDTARYKDAVREWGLVKYLEVMDSFTFVSRIKHPNEPWG